MEVNIHFNHSVSDKDSLHLDQLADILQQDYDLPVQTVRKNSADGVKDGGLTIALSIIGISISAIGTIISALSYWKSQQPDYSISVKSGNKTITVDNVHPGNLPEMVSSLEEAFSSDTEIVISAE